VPEPLPFRRDPEGTHPPLECPAYLRRELRAPRRRLEIAPATLAELDGPVYGEDRVEPGDADLTAGPGGEPLGERIVVSGRLLDGDGRPLRGALVEVWQANAAGRYTHAVDRHPAPLDPNFEGAGRCLTDAEGRYRFVTIKPGAYPWRNGGDAWRPAHIHFSLFGRAFAQRLVTQMYFPGDPLLELDPIFNSVPDPVARQRLVSRFDIEAAEPARSLAYEFDIVLRGPAETPMGD
jgi:protocatechuate 3,4-dioxygenase beta subunit